MEETLNSFFISHDRIIKAAGYEFRDFFEKLFKKLKDEFSATHQYKVSEWMQAGNPIIFLKQEKEITSSKRMIRLLLYYEDPVDKTTALSVSLIFEYYPKRIKSLLLKQAFTF